MEELDDWIRKGDPRNSVRVISGEPGCGKSSFAKILAARLAETGSIRVLFIPLHHFEPSDDLVDAIDDFVRIDRFLTHNPVDLEDGDSRIVLIFDGLDELTMQGSLSEQVARSFVREVQRTVDRINLHGIRVQALIGGRELVVQANVSEFRKPGEVLYILPYYVTKDDARSYDDPNGLLSEDQRSNWWKKYGDLVGKSYRTMPSELNRAQLAEITSQPLLNYLVALSYARQKIDFSTESNLNAIFTDLLSAVYERGWETHPHPSTIHIDEKYFVRVLEEIALAAWHGDGRTTTVKEIRQHCDRSGLGRFLGAFEAGAEAGVMSLLAAFYFRQRGFRPDGERTFEFTHKSFGEFLTAKRIVRAVEKMNYQMVLRRIDPDDGWDEKQSLVHWVTLCGPTAMDRYLFSFICNEIKLYEVEKLGEWQAALCALASVMFKVGMPMGNLDTNLDYREMGRQARNSEEAVFATLNACARLTRTISVIEWPRRTAFGEFISRLHSSRSGPTNVLGLGCLSWLDLQGCFLDIKDLYCADLYRSNLSGAELHYTILVSSNLHKAKLQKANLFRANLEGANLKECDLRHVDLRDANLSDANLQRADIRNGNLLRANLRRANLQRVKLAGANLEEADLTNADLAGADLTGANLKGVELEGANLDGTIFKGTILESKYLKEKRPDKKGTRTHSSKGRNRHGRR